jgi:class 3 adenylate cyclase
VAHLGRRTYHRDVVGARGAGAGRSTAIVLFTDLVASTELRSRLGEEAADAVRRQHDGLVMGAIEANRGRLDRGERASADEALRWATTVLRSTTTLTRTGRRDLA